MKDYFGDEAELNPAQREIWEALKKNLRLRNNGIIYKTPFGGKSMFEELWEKRNKDEWRVNWRALYADHAVDAFRYAEEGRRWRMWFDSQPWWYRTYWKAKQWLTRQLTRAKRPKQI